MGEVVGGALDLIGEVEEVDEFIVGEVQIAEEVGGLGL